MSRLLSGSQKRIRCSALCATSVAALSMSLAYCVSHFAGPDPDLNPSLLPAASAANNYSAALKAFNTGAYGLVEKYLSKLDTVDEAILYGRWNMAIKSDNGMKGFTRAMQLDGGSSKSRLYMALAYADIHDFEEALKQLKIALSKDAKNAELLSTQGRCQYKLGQTEEGMAAMRAALAQAPGSEIVVGNLARVYTESFDTRAAEDFHSRLVQLKKGCVQPLLERAYFYIQAGQDKKALADFESALKINSQCQVAYWQRAYFWQQRKEYKKAVDDCNRCLVCKDPLGQLERRVLRLKVDAQERLKRYADAAEDSKKLTKDAGLLVGNWGVRGDVLRQAALLERVGKYKDALKALDPLYKAAPNRTEVMFLRARILGKAGDYGESLYLCNKLIALDTNMPDWYRMRARALTGLGRKEQAAKDLEKAKSLGASIPDLPSIYQDK